MKIGRPKTTGNCSTRAELERLVRRHYRDTTASMRVIAAFHNISVATVWRILAN
jgi:hypothetical protein